MKGQHREEMKDYFEKLNGQQLEEQEDELE